MQEKPDDLFRLLLSGDEPMSLHDQFHYSVYPENRGWWLVVSKVGFIQETPVDRSLPDCCMPIHSLLQHPPG